MNQKEAQRAISLLCDELKIMLLCKNREYGNSALEPRRIFSKTTAVEQILIRIDDKLSRILTTRGKDTVIKEDTILDLIGYLILLKIAQEDIQNLTDKKQEDEADFEVKVESALFSDELSEDEQEVLDKYEQEVAAPDDDMEYECPLR